jgi:hypothetical protein
MLQCTHTFISQAVKELETLQIDVFLKDNDVLDLLEAIKTNILPDIATYYPGWWFFATPLKNDGVSSSVGMMTNPQDEWKVIQTTMFQSPPTSIT